MKVIKLFGILAAASILFSFNAFAQEDGNRDADGNVVRGPYVTNGFFDNTFISVGAGANSVLEKTYGLGKFGLATDLNIGKWLTPTVGVRAGWHGLKNTSKSGEFDKAAKSAATSQESEAKSNKKFAAGCDVQKKIEIFKKGVAKLGVDAKTKADADKVLKQFDQISSYLTGK